MPPVIDAHIHLIKPFDSAGMPQRYSVWKEDGTAKPTSAEDFIALMDACGVDQAFYISWSPGGHPVGPVAQGNRSGERSGDDERDLPARRHAALR